MPSTVRIHITGASGSGTSTLGAALANHLCVTHFDADNFYWLPTDPPYTAKREPAFRLTLLVTSLREAGNSILSGSVMNWGSEIEDSFDLVVFLYLDASIRVERLRKREIEKLGHADPEFLEWEVARGPAFRRTMAGASVAWPDSRSTLLSFAQAIISKVSCETGHPVLHYRRWSAHRLCDSG